MFLKPLCSIEAFWAKALALLTLPAEAREIALGTGAAEVGIRA
jgi:hypothetical protein